MEKTLLIDKYMTLMPFTINPSMPLRKAMDMMREHGIRHIPVQKDGHLVGIVSDRDVKLGASIAKNNGLLVEDVMTPDPYAVHPGTKLKEVVGEMAMRKIGSTVINTDSGRVIGIFTATDVLRALGDIL